MPSSLADFEVLTKIGQGSFGQCYKIKRKSDNQVLVWKKMHVLSSKIQMVYKETSLLRQMDHPNIIKYVGFIHDRSTEHVYIITQYYQHGDLETLLKSMTTLKRYMSEKDIWKILCQLCVALEYCHDKDIIHRDIKPANIFISGSHDVVLGDFGVAKQLAPTPEAHTFCGTPIYMSPDIFNCKSYNAKTDVWSLGCVLFHLCSLEPPFKPNPDQHLFHLINAGLTKRLPNRYSEQLNDTINKMITVQVFKRPSIKEVVQWPWLAEKFAALNVSTGHINNC